MFRTLLLYFFIVTSSFAQDPKEKHLIDSINSISDTQEKKLFIQNILTEKGFSKYTENFKAEILHKQGSNFFFEDKNKSSDYFKKSLQHRIKAVGKLHVDYARTLFNLALVNNDLGYFNLAIEQFKEAANVYKINKNPSEFYALYHVGRIYQKIGENKLSEFYLKNAELGSSTINDIYTNIDSKNGLAELFFINEDYSLSLKYFLDVLNALKDLGPQDFYYKDNLGVALFNISQAYYRLKDYNASLYYAQKALKEQNNSVEKYRPAMCNYIIGNCLTYLKNSTLAKTYFLNGLELLKEDNSFTGKENRAMIYCGLGRLEGTSSRYFKLALKEFGILQKKKSQGAIENNISLPLYTPFLVMIEEYIPFMDQKLEYFELCDNIIDKLRSSQVFESSKFFWRNKTYRIYDYAITTCVKENNLEKAFYFIEKSRAILLLDAIKSSEAAQVLKPEQQEKEQALRYQLITLQNQLSNETEGSKTYTDILNKIINTQEEYTDLSRTVERSNPTFYNLKYNQKYLSLKDLQNQLKPSQTYLSFFTGEKNMYLLSVTKTKVQIKTLDKVKFEKMVFDINRLNRKELTKSEWTDYQNIAFSLYETIFKDLDISGEEIIVSDDTHTFPMEALLFKPNGTKQDFLLFKYTFTYAYSANLQFRELKKRFDFKTRMLSVAPVSFSENLSPLPGSEEIASKIINETFGGKTLIGKAANKQSFLGNMRRYHIIQLFTHGVSSDSTGNPSIFLEDSRLELNEFYGLKSSRAHLAVLSACETGVGESSTGEGIQSIARGFSLIGIPSLISTLWKVNDQSTYYITERFYNYLYSGIPKNEALKKAKIDYLNANPNFSPYYWASMVLVGDESPVQKGYYIYLVWVLVVLVLLGVFYFVQKKFTKKPKSP